MALNFQISEQLTRSILEVVHESKVLPPNVEEGMAQCREILSGEIGGLVCDIAHRVDYLRKQGEIDPPEATLSISGGLNPNYIAELNDRLGLPEEQANEIMHALHAELIAFLPPEGVELVGGQKLEMKNGELVLVSSS